MSIAMVIQRPVLVVFTSTTTSATASGVVTAPTSGTSATTTMSSSSSRTIIILVTSITSAALGRVVAAAMRGALKAGVLTGWPDDIFVVLLEASLMTPVQGLLALTMFSGVFNS
ncbi:hypothetical protein HAV15_004660 [Penicillium sp. str. |nr:hypothetical protein HAV15_004660 [Penicillium sp. str. \